MKVTIIGAGLGGLAAALALRQRGIECEVYERTPTVGEIGAGIQLGPNAYKVLRALGLEERLRQQAFAPPRQIVLNWNDASIRAEREIGETYLERFGAPYMTAHRADLHRMLLESLPEKCVHLGRACVGASMQDGQAVARFEDGFEAEADVLVGADGIRSTVRKVLFGDDRPRFANSVAWRCVVDVGNLPRRVGPGEGIELRRSDYFAWYGPTGQVICYPIGDGSILNVYAGKRTEEWVEESWSLPSSRQELLQAFVGWNEALLEMFESVEHCFKWGIFDRAPRKEWTSGHITLLGDAAHPTMPNLAQGANMAIEDGYVLARHLAGEKGTEAALAAYVAERQPRTARITLQSRENFLNSMRMPPAPAIDRSWIYSFDATLEPEHPSTP